MRARVTLRPQTVTLFGNACMHFVVANPTGTSETTQRPGEIVKTGGTNVSDIDGLTATGVASKPGVPGNREINDLRRKPQKVMFTGGDTVKYKQVEELRQKARYMRERGNPEWKHCCAHMQITLHVASANHKFGCICQDVRK